MKFPKHDKPPSPRPGDPENRRLRQRLQEYNPERAAHLHPPLPGLLERQAREEETLHGPPPPRGDRLHAGLPRQPLLLLPAPRGVQLFRRVHPPGPGRGLVHDVRGGIHLRHGQCSLKNQRRAIVGQWVDLGGFFDGCVLTWRKMAKSPPKSMTLLVVPWAKGPMMTVDDQQRERPNAEDRRRQRFGHDQPRSGKHDERGALQPARLLRCLRPFDRHVQHRPRLHPLSHQGRRGSRSSQAGNKFPQGLFRPEPHHADLEGGVQAGPQEQEEEDLRHHAAADGHDWTLHR